MSYANATIILMAATLVMITLFAVIFLIPELRKRVKERLTKSRRFNTRHEIFKCLVEKYGLLGKVDYREDWIFGKFSWTLVPIKKEGHEPEPLPPGFLTEVKELCWWKLEMGPAKTVGEILEYERAFAGHCQLFHCCD